VSAESVLYTTLTAATAVTAIVSTRIYPDVVPQEQAVPAIAYARLETDPVITLHSNAPVAETATLEVVCMASTRAGAEALGDAVRAALGAAGFRILGRSSQYDDEQQLWGAVLVVEKFVNL
jgi:hypothetical protein